MLGQGFIERQNENVASYKFALACLPATAMDGETEVGHPLQSIARNPRVSHNKKTNITVSLSITFNSFLLLHLKFNHIVYRPVGSVLLWSVCLLVSLVLRRIATSSFSTRKTGGAFSLKLSGWMTAHVAATLVIGAAVCDKMLSSFYSRRDS